MESLTDKKRWLSPPGESYYRDWLCFRFNSNIQHIYDIYIYSPKQIENTPVQKPVLCRDPDDANGFAAADLCLYRKGYTENKKARNCTKKEPLQRHGVDLHAEQASSFSK